jgi:hypothetical protein
MKMNAIFFVCCALVACQSTKSTPSEAALIGVYSYHSDDPKNKATDQSMDRLTLRADGSYELLEGGPTKHKSRRIGSWHLVRGERPELVLDHAGYPIELSGKVVRLLIDTDVGIWYSKVE